MPVITAEAVASGSAAPQFTLPDAMGRDYSLQQLRGPAATLIVFFSATDPICHRIGDELALYARRYAPLGVNVVAINANDPQQDPGASAEAMIDTLREHDFDFPYLIDSSQDVAKRFHAACTPEFFLFDAGLRLYYHGGFKTALHDEYLPPATDLLTAAGRLLRQEAVAGNTLPARGTPIRWKAGNAPDYFYLPRETVSYSY